MLKGCPATKKFWEAVNQIGSQHWATYKNFDYNFIPVLLDSYKPRDLYILSALWALWVQWCCHFHEAAFTDSQQSWVNEALTRFKEQFYKRVIEAPSAIRWLRLAQERRVDPDQPRIPEKEFLLVQSQSIKANDPTLPRTREGELDPLILDWVASATLLDLDVTFYHRPRLRINHAVWGQFLDNPPPQPGPAWLVGQPQSVVGQ